MLTFAEFLAKRRAALGMSMTEVAAQLGVTPQYISLLEAARCNPSRRLQERCARFFDENPEYIRFLAQPIPEAHKEALLRTPAVLSFLPKRAHEAAQHRERADRIPLDAEDIALRRLFRPLEQGALSDSDVTFYERLARELAGAENGEPPVSGKAQAWGRYYAAVLEARTQGVLAAQPRFAALMKLLRSDVFRPCPDVLRMEVSQHVARGAVAGGQWQEAAAAFEEAGRTALLLDDGVNAVEAYQNAARAYRQGGRPDSAMDMLAAVIGADDVPAPTKAALLGQRARLLYDLADMQGALESVQQAARIWRLRSLGVAHKTTRLVTTQVFGLHLFVELGHRQDARQWLGRIRSTLARIGGEEMPAPAQARIAAESDLGSAALMLQQRRLNHALKNVAAAEARADAGELLFEDADDETIFRTRVALLRAQAAHGRQRTADVRRFAGRVLTAPALDDALREKGIGTLLRLKALLLLGECEKRDDLLAAWRALLDGLDPNQQPTAALRNLCRAPQIQRLREHIAALEFAETP